jgi:hypothetical protein
MNQDMSSGPAPEPSPMPPPQPMMQAPLPEEPRKSTNTWLIVGIVLVVLCCCCLIAAALAWQYGDQILKALQVQ